MTNIKPSRDSDWRDGQVDAQRVGRGMLRFTAYAIRFDGTFVGYVAGRDGGWSQQPEQDPTASVAPSWQFGFAGPSRRNAIDNLLFDARTAGIIPPKEHTP